MIDLVLEKLPQIKSICERHGVRKMELFGSAARDDFRPDASDLDFAVEFFDISALQRFRARLDLEDEMGALFGRKADIVELEDVKNPYVLKTILEDKQPVYAAA